MNIAIIPARGGSKRIPRKNIKLFMGKPMISWSIGVAQAAGIFDRIIVSTDDLEIARVANQYGAEVPFVRPNDLSDDYVGTTEVIAHATQWVLEQGLDVKAVCCIYATAPFNQVIGRMRFQLLILLHQFSEHFISNQTAVLRCSFLNILTCGHRICRMHYTMRGSFIGVSLMLG